MWLDVVHTLGCRKLVDVSKVTLVHLLGVLVSHVRVPVLGVAHLVCVLRGLLSAAIRSELAGQLIFIKFCGSCLLGEDPILVLPG